MAVLTALVMPVVMGGNALISLDIPYLTKIMLAIPALLLIWLDFGMIKQAIVQQKEEGLTTLWLPIVGQSVWFVVLVWLLFAPAKGVFVQTMTLPIMLLGWAGLMVTLGIMQRRERVIALDTPGITSAKRLQMIAVVIAIYAALFYGLTVNWQSGLTVAVAVFIVFDPRWPAMWAAWRRFNILRDLAELGMTFQNPHVLDNISKVTDIVIEKNGILTTGDVNIRSISSLDDRYSDFDILGITSGLLQNFDNPLSDAIMQYARNYGVYPSDATEPELVPLVGVKGVINNEPFSIVSANYAAANYAINDTTLEALIDLGNSVSYIVDGVQVVGILSFATHYDVSLMSFDRFFNQRGIKFHVFSADTRGSVEGLQKVMSTLATVETDLPADDKLAKQAEFLQTENTILVTNQAVPEGVTDAMVISIGDNLEFADVKMPNIDILHELWNTADSLSRNDHRVLNWATILSVVLILLAGGIGVFITPLLFIAPIIAVIIRLILSLTLAQVVATDE
jgi:cation transport ATPase